MTIQAPELTLAYLAIFGVLYAALSLVVVVLRIKLDTPYGDGGNEHLLHAIRAHGNFAEWVPLICLLVAGLEMLGQPELRIHMLMGTLLAARVLHPIGMLSAVGTRMYFVGRICGAFSTWAVLLAASFFALPFSP
ncbi:MAG: MAPEG family protein [Pseudomonadaceae bacterium]|nr:MAPEG family protein [Pseudomonadaceae bacterium]